MYQVRFFLKNKFITNFKRFIKIDIRNENERIQFQKIQNKIFDRCS